MSLVQYLPALPGLGPAMQPQSISSPCQVPGALIRLTRLQPEPIPENTLPIAGLGALAADFRFQIQMDYVTPALLPVAARFPLLAEKETRIQAGATASAVIGAGTRALQGQRAQNRG